MRPREVRCFSNLDDFMGDVDRLLSDLSSENVTAGEGSWSSVDWGNCKLRETKASPVEEKTIRNRQIYIKRDDLLRLHGSQVSGNKARKMLALNEVPAVDFPACLVSYGGPQSNSMLALAAVSNYKSRELCGENDTTEQLEEETSSSTEIEDSKGNKRRFVYYTKKLPRFLRNQPSGNLFRALALGMELVELTQQEYVDLFDSYWGGSPEPPLGLDPPASGDSLWVSSFLALIGKFYSVHPLTLTFDHPGATRRCL
jgi:hypothetical protein